MYRPTSEPSVSLPDCSQSSCDDNEDKDTLDAPEIVQVSMLKYHEKEMAYQVSAYACQLDALAYPGHAARVEANETPPNMPAELSAVLFDFISYDCSPGEGNHLVLAGRWHPLDLC